MGDRRPYADQVSLSALLRPPKWTVTPSPRQEKQVLVTILLTNEQTVRLNEISAGIRRRTAKSISRSALIRALISALPPYYQSFLDCRTEADIRQKIARTLELLTSK